MRTSVYILRIVNVYDALNLLEKYVCEPIALNSHELILWKDSAI